MVNPRREVGAEFLSTPANIANTGRVCGIYSPGDENCVAQISALSDAMEAVPSGSYARPPGATQDVEEVSEHRAEAAMLHALTCIALLAGAAAAVVVENATGEALAGAWMVVVMRLCWVMRPR